MKLFNLFFSRLKAKSGINNIVLCGGIVLSGAGNEVYAGDMILSPGPDKVVSGDHSHEHISFNGNNLTVKSSARVGNVNESGSHYRTGHVGIEGGASMMGQHIFENNVMADVGVSGTSPVKMDYAGLHNYAKVNFDNVRLTGISDSPKVIQPLTLYDNSQATLSSRTWVGTATEGMDGVELFDKSHLSVTGSTIIGYANGILAAEDSSLSLDHAQVTGGWTGLRVTTSGDVRIVGGNVAGTGNTPNATAGAEGGVVVGDITPGLKGAHVVISEGANIRGTGAGYSGIVSIINASGDNRIDVTDSKVAGEQHGVRFASPSPKGGGGASILTASHSDIISDKGAAIAVDGSSHANVQLVDGTKLISGNGVGLLAEKDSVVQLTVKNSQLAGDIINNGGTVNVRLANGAGWNGGMKQVSSLSIEPGTVWTAATASSVGQMHNDGLVILSREGMQRNIVTVSDYTSRCVGSDKCGEVRFNSTLAGDDSPVDKLVITGNSSGRSMVSVQNLGGHGDKTIDGIELIHTKGMAQTDFIQKGRIAAGAYDYTLMHNADKSSWYLTSKGPTPYQSESKVYRPETGSYLANLDAARTMFVTRLRDREGDSRLLEPQSMNNDAPASLWLRQTGDHRSFSDSSGQIKTQSNTYVVQLGGDIAQWSMNGDDRWHLGIMGGYGHSHSRSRSSLSDYTSRGDVDGYSTGVYGTWYADSVENTGAYVDTWAHYSWFNSHVAGSALASESYKSHGVTASLESGYTIKLAGSDKSTGYYLEPQAQLVWMGVHGNGMSEGNGTRVEAEGKTNIQSRLGMKAFMKGHSHVDDGKGRTFQPFIEANWIHNTSTPGINMDGESDHQAGAANIGELKMGVEGRLSQGLQVWATTGQQLGGKGYADTTASLGVRYSF